ncbi:MAG: archaellin/type IV pilin N-terminal domain-containing protein [Candidatus Hodarchaeales archaeon]|jgi:FlaG/FlaF family flagellin (archaellin)
MNLIKIYRRRRAVSPILAAILLIGLAVAAGAVLFVVVLPMIQSSGELYYGETTLSDIDTDGFNDKLVFTLTNELSDGLQVTNIVLQGRTGTGTWTTFATEDNTTTNFPFSITLSQSKIGIVFTFDPGTYDELRIKVDYSVDGVAEDPLYSAAYDIAV